MEFMQANLVSAHEHATAQHVLDILAVLRKMQCSA